MYWEHFGLDRPPFKITPDTSLFYEGNKRGAALDALVYAISSGEGIIKVVGEVGSGKTMLCRMLEIRLPDVVDVVYIANPSLSPDNILHVIAHELDLGVDTQTSKLDVMQKLQAYLLDKHENNRQVVLFVEEAQSMPIETLEEIRLLSNLETEQSKLLQMVLFGQPELDEKLRLPHIRQLKERITHCFYLDPFSSSNTLEYLNFRLRNVGYRGPDVFSQKTANLVEKFSDGLTRRINILADKSLMASYSEGGHAVTAKHVKIAAKDSDFDTRWNFRPWIWAGSALMVLMLAVAVGTLLPNYFNIWKQNEHIAKDLQPVAVRPIVAKSETNHSIKTDMSSEQSSHSKEVNIENSHENNASIKEKIAPQPAVASVKAPVQVASESKQAEGFDEIEAATSNQDTGSISEGLLQHRLEATRQWIENASESHFSIQLFMASRYDTETVEIFLKKPPEILDIEKIYIYETVINGQPLYSVLYNEYISYAGARSILKNLPGWLQDSGSYLRRINTFREALLSKQQARLQSDLA